ncbi:hypothetical protein D9X30_3298 [Cupriavidus sp. U2]|uniref:MFS transporter n=1 Tax=Cupriavidus sp. U2 TaxID=2920269 RepID=UPI00129D80F9|nr:MFS transporter [Cupriavidus sp. U2]KAI3591773.1 hypothetical protein D9X30_3298 [Cupriavidus sp. U2]
MKLPVPLLAAAAFAILTNEFNIIGVIPLIAQDLDVPVPQVGLLVTAFAFTVAITGPFLTLALRRVERRQLFTGVLAVTAVGAAIAAMAPNYGVLAAGRIASALALPVFWSMATSTAARISEPGNAGRAISTVFAGVSIASVIGSPITTILADAFGWRMAFAAGAALCATMALLMWKFFPRMEALPEDTPHASFRSLIQPKIVSHLAMSFLALTAMFTSYTYLADLLTRVGHFSSTSTGWILMGFGVAGIVGNEIAGRFVDENPLRAAVAAVVIAGPAMAAFPYLLDSHLAAMAALAVWGAAHAAGFVTNHVRTIRAVPPELQDVTASLSVSIFNAGIGMGAVVGGNVIGALGLREIGVAGALIGGLALGVATVIALAARSPRIIPDRAGAVLGRQQC